MTAGTFVPSSKAASLPVVFLGFLGSLQLGDPIVASLAIVKATKTLEFSPTMQALAASISTLALAATVVPSGVVADKIGRRKLLILALAVALVGDVVAAAAPVGWVFLLGRAIAGVGFGAIFAGAFGFVRSVVTEKTLSAALGVFAGVCSVPLFIFMPLGSALANFNWRLTFLMIPVFAALGIVGCFFILPHISPVAASEKKQPWGLIALGIGIVGLLMGVSAMAKSFTSPNTLVPLAVGVVGVALFGLIESKSAHPTYPVELFKSPLFLVGAIGGLAWNSASAVGQLLSSNLWQYVDGLSPFQASLRQLPVMIFSIIASILAGRVMAKGRGSVTVLVAGGVLTIVGLAGAGLLAKEATGVLFLVVLCVAFFGCGVMTVPQSQMFVVESPAAFYGPVTSSRTCVGQLGYAIGLAGGTAVVSSVAVTQLSTSAGVAQAQADSEVAAFIAGKATQLTQVADAYVGGFAAAMFAFAGFVLVCTLVIVALGRPAARRAAEHEQRIAATSEA